ncbi:MAG: hypothetical protein HYR56_35230 [Acidobacteria bacterium]|nr:hypothetical protein [Acidobacteriota bacterium]
MFEFEPILDSGNSRICLSWHHRGLAGPNNNKFEKVMNMSKAKLIKKDSPLQEQLLQQRKQRRQRSKKTSTPARTAFEITTDWLKSKSKETPSARQAFAALFAEPDPQSA